MDWVKLSCQRLDLDAEISSIFFLFMNFHQLWILVLLDYSNNHEQCALFQSFLILSFWERQWARGRKKERKKEKKKERERKRKRKRKRTKSWELWLCEIWYLPIDQRSHVYLQIANVLWIIKQALTQLTFVIKFTFAVKIALYTLINLNEMHRIV